MALAALLLVGGYASVGNAAQNAAAAPAAPGDVVAVAIGAGSFNTLVAAIKAADLVGALQGTGPFTVFAPTDAAFAALPAGTLDNLLKPENKEQLKSILLYHVVPGKVMSGDLKGTVNAATLQGQAVSIVAAASGVTVNGARVVKADVAASNGVIHVIDAVILPPAK
ncbi:MAG: fasciclin domain-containing protein [Gammaproteobacteria bacterium]|nr:fasciclin domain-containing protein [Gammaproteobacteria bacterium]